MRAGRLGLPLALAIIGGMPERFTPFVDLYRDVAARSGHAELPVGVNTHAYLADTTDRAADEFYPSYALQINRIGLERGRSGRSRSQFDALRSPRGALAVGTPEEVTEKILFQHDLFGHSRFLAQFSVGTLPHKGVMHATELLGTKVASVVREEIARRTKRQPVANP